VIGVLCVVTNLPAQQPTFRAGVRTVAVYATVQDTGGTLVPGLTRDDFEVFEDGTRRNIVQFSSEPQPLNVALMLLTGGGMLPPQAGLAGRLRYRDAILAFIDALNPEDRARIGTFGLQIAVGAHLTSDRSELRRVLNEEVWAGGGNPQWQAISAAMRSIADEPQRRVVLVITNGTPVTRLPGMEGGRAAVEAQAASCACMVYAVTLSRALGDALEDVATTSGGGYVQLREDADLEAAFVRLAEELRHQYLIGFEPEAADGLSHRIDVRATRPGLLVRARRSFVAGAP
jgi:Ca-activated chloride channel family protein